MSNIRTLAVTVPLLLALSACGDDAAVETGDDGREASGEVLEGSISDEMLPVDQVRSQAPLAESADEEAGSGGSAAPAPEVTQPPELDAE